MQLIHIALTKKRFTRKRVVQASDRILPVPRSLRASNNTSANKKKSFTSIDTDSYLSFIKEKMKRDECNDKLMMDYFTKHNTSTQKEVSLKLENLRWLWKMHGDGSIDDDVYQKIKVLGEEYNKKVIEKEGFGGDDGLDSVNLSECNILHESDVVH